MAHLRHSRCNTVLVPSLGRVAHLVLFGLVVFGCDYVPQPVDTDMRPGEMTSAGERVGLAYQFSIHTFVDLAETPVPRNVDNEAFPVPEDIRVPITAEEAEQLAYDVTQAASYSTHARDFKCCFHLTMTEYSVGVPLLRLEGEDYDMREVDTGLDPDKWRALTRARIATVVFVWRLKNRGRIVRGTTKNRLDGEPPTEFGFPRGSGSIVLGYGATGSVLLHEMLHYKGVEHREVRVPEHRGLCVEEDDHAPLMCRDILVRGGNIDQAECRALWSLDEWGQEDDDRPLVRTLRANCPG